MENAAPALKLLASAAQIEREEKLVLGWRLALLRAGCGLFAAAGLDLLLPLPAALRAASLLVAIGYVLWIARDRKRASQEVIVDSARLARLIEERVADSDNALIHAVQLGSSGAATGGALRAGLVAAELRRANTAASSISPSSVSNPEALRRSGTRLRLLCGLVAASVLLFPRGWRFEAPRFLAFWTDPPPFTWTDFTLIPETAVLPFGGSQEIRVRTDGLEPERVYLLLRTRRGAQQTVPMIETEAGLYTATIEKIEEDLCFHAAANTGRSTSGSIHVDPAPRLERAEAVVTPPAYAGLPLERKRLGGEPLEAAAGSLLRFRFDTTVPLREAALILSAPGGQETRVPLRIPSKAIRSAEGIAKLKRDMEYHLDVVTEDGYTANRLASGSLRALPDHPPQIAIPSPGQDVLATPEMRVPIAVEASDDLRLGEVAIRIWRNGSQSETRLLGERLPAARVTATESLAPAKLGAKPGDTIDYEGVARDTNPARLAPARTKRFRIQVVSQATYRDALARAAGENPRGGNQQARARAQAGKRSGGSALWPGGEANGAIPAELAMKGRTVRGTARPPAGRIEAQQITVGETETVPTPEAMRAAASDTRNRRIPEAYRELVSDYFRAVANGK